MTCVNREARNALKTNQASRLIIPEKNRDRGEIHPDQAKATDVNGTKETRNRRQDGAGKGEREGGDAKGKGWSERRQKSRRVERNGRREILLCCSL